MVDKIVKLEISKEPVKDNGGQPTSRIYDELDALVWTYGREAVLKMFEDAKPNIEFVAAQQGIIIMGI